MKARRAVKTAKRASDYNALKLARQNVNEAKIALGERGPIWWGNNQDYIRHLVNNTPYAGWWATDGRRDTKLPSIGPKNAYSELGVFLLNASVHILTSFKDDSCHRSILCEYFVSDCVVWNPCWCRFLFLDLV